MTSPHPILERPDLPPEWRIQILEQALARLWDQVWWMQLSPERRVEYERQGFKAPIIDFYNDGGASSP